MKKLFLAFLLIEFGALFSSRDYAGICSSEVRWVKKRFPYVSDQRACELVVYFKSQGNPCSDSQFKKLFGYLNHFFRPAMRGSEVIFQESLGLMLGSLDE